MVRGIVASFIEHRSNWSGASGSINTKSGLNAKGSLGIVKHLGFMFCNQDVSYIHTYHSRFITERIAEVSQIFLRDAHVLPKLLSYEEYCRRD
jgi:hypothetical protein